MTNFEKWKETLTPSNIIDNGCNNCPLCWMCEEHWGTYECCLKFERWANAEAKEEEFKTRQLHLVKKNYAWNAKKPWCNYYWADNETPQHSYPAFCEDGHATRVCAKDLDVHVTCEACAYSKNDYPGIMTGLSGMVKDVQFDDDAASQIVLAIKSHSVFFRFTDEVLLNVLDRLIKDRDEKQSATSKQGDHPMIKREIVDRLLSIYVQDDHAIPGAVRDFILDIAAPEEETKEEEKHPASSPSRGLR